MRAVLPFLLALAASLAQDMPLPENDASLLQRRDRPNELNLPFEDCGFVVVRVRISNPGPESLVIVPNQIQFLNPKGKPVPLAGSKEIVPKMMKSGTAVPKLDAEVGGYRGPTYGRPMSPTILSSGNRTGVVDVGRIDRLRQIIEKHQLKDTTLEPGTSVEGVIFIQTKESPERLAGSRVVVTPALSLTVK